MRLLCFPSVFLSSFLAAAALATIPTRADAKLARCFTTDDGYYDCDIKATDKDGSFEISAPKKPRYGLIMDEPGLASAFVMRGTSRNVALPGKFKRNKQDLACWYNAETRVRICVW
ncbi:hypothetical protein PY365_05340 [Roseiarcaceae bacterium H3SJ34-1]|uniref:hypothetical protein n=1 Tax=Terripilifer ovatus TaxID=3032367 RepID=UPI003AB9447E|nr:hypothetical protein [Roseiarcaceae bacterium H3SJ34-1]